MNAVAPSTVKAIAANFDRARIQGVFVDGSIIGGPPSLKGASADGEWYVPSMPLSGPTKLLDLPYGEALAKSLGMYHISPDIGAASGLKMCFASMSKGYTAISIQAWTTAQRMGVLGELKDVLGSMVPARLAQTEKGLVGMAPKAYRWVREMEEISRTFAEEGGFEPELFKGAAGVFKAVAEDTVLGQEKIGQRKRGTTADDTAAAIAEGLAKKKKKTE
ncbi:6-phosphogluconate dehydrogenase C-terminal domain-like protein [Thozetella sp. PMI_491]|nr:6-phosphogluconate dehydrogenase C-terminal domain-like protein [Thozetella sp. PMI_491]